MDDPSELIVVNRPIDFLIPEDTRSAREMAQYVAKIAFHNFEWRFVTILLFIEATSLGVGDFIKAYENTVIIKQEPMSWFTNHTAYAKQFVVYGHTIADILSILDVIAIAKYDNTGRYLIVCTDPECEEAAVISACWNLKIVNVIFIRNVNEYRDAAAFSYFPYSPGVCEDRRPVRLDIPTSCENEFCFMNLFPEKCGNLYMCPIIASTFHQPPFMFLKEGYTISGRDGDLLLLLLGLINASLVVVTPAHGEGWGYFKDNDWWGSLGDVFNNRANLSITSGAVTLSRYTSFHVSNPYNTIDLVWITSPSSAQPSWKKLIYPYKLGVWISLGGMFVAVFIINYILKTQKWDKIRKSINMDAQNNNLFFLSWVIFIGLPVSRLPTKSVSSAIFLMWVWFSFLIRTGYQAALVSSLKLEIFESDYGTFETAAADKQIPFGGVASLKEYFMEDSWILDGWTEIQASEILSTFIKLSEGNMDFIMGLNKEIVLEFLQTDYGIHKLQIIPQKIVNIQVAVFFKKYSPIANPMSRLLSVVTEAGLSQRLFERYSAGLRQQHDNWERKRSHPQPLRVDHLSGCWALIIAGWIISIILFLVEVLWCKWPRK